MSLKEAKERILQLATGLEKVFIGRSTVIRTMITAMVAQEPMLFVGPPGTAKSLLISTFCAALGVKEGEYFEYLLTRYSEPGEILGPVDIQKLKNGTYIRKTTGQLPEARIAFLDEIFKANSAILNILLTLINEKKFYQDGKPVTVPLQMLFAASNEIPTFGEFDALKDRFVLKMETRPVQEDNFDELIRVGFSLDAGTESRQVLRGLPDIGCSLADFQELNRYLRETVMARCSRETDGIFGDDEIDQMFRSLVAMIKDEEDVAITDRKLIKLAKLVLADAVVFSSGEEVCPENLAILAYAGNDFAEIRRLELHVRERLLGMGSAG